MNKEYFDEIKFCTLDCGIEVNSYLTYAQIQQIINAVIKFDNWADREMNIDLLILYHATNLTKEDIEGIGHDKFIQSGLIDEVRKNIVNLYQIYQAIEYTESIARSLAMISKNLPELIDESFKKVVKNGSKK
nr:MAG TPA: hypothetical protein [Caudoviricetes sp.]